MQNCWAGKVDRKKKKQKKNVFVFIMEKFGIHRIEPGILKKKKQCANVVFINAQINNLLNVTCVSLNCNLCNVQNKYYYVKRQDKSISLIVITGKSYLLIRKLTLSCILYPQQRKIGTYTFMMPLQNLKAMTLTYNCLFSCLLLSFFI